MIKLTIAELFLDKALKMLGVPNTRNLAALWLHRGDLPELLGESHRPLRLILHRLPVALLAQDVFEHNNGNFSPLLLSVFDDLNEFASELDFGVREPPEVLLVGYSIHFLQALYGLL